jgi:hypothetical protein
VPGDADREEAGGAACSAYRGRVTFTTATESVDDTATASRARRRRAAAGRITLCLLRNP